MLNKIPAGSVFSTEAQEFQLGVLRTSGTLQERYQAWAMRPSDLCVAHGGAENSRYERREFWPIRVLLTGPRLFVVGFQVEPVETFTGPARASLRAYIELSLQLGAG